MKRPHFFAFLSLACLTLATLSSGLFASEARMTPLVKAVQKAQKAVVNIHTEKTAKDQDNIFGSGKARRVTGMGTGVVIDERGYIVTNFHVVSEVEVLEISLADGAHYAARVVAFDKNKDLAVLKVDRDQPFEVMTMGTSSDLMLGETVFAVGNAFGYVHTVTSGIVSYLSRDVEVNETQSYQDLIQTDASINPGNSGGPLLNLDGEVIGINVAIRAGAQRIGFAIPIDDARNVLADLLNTQTISGTYHGLATEDKKNGTDRHLVVRKPDPGSPSEEAGFQAGDVILSVKDHTITDRVDFERWMLDVPKGQKMTVEVERGGETKTLELALRQSDKATVIMAQNSHTVNKIATPVNFDSNSPEQKVWDKLGMKLVKVPKDQIHPVHSKYNGGMVVTEVRQGSPAAKHGIRNGDILVGLHQWETVKSEDVAFVIENADLEKFNPLRFYILRGREVLYGYLQLK
jgi:serine protease Do